MHVDKTIILGCAIGLLCLLGACKLLDRQSPTDQQDFEEALDAIFLENQFSGPANEILTKTPLPLTAPTTTLEPAPTVTTLCKLTGWKCRTSLELAER